MTGRRPRRSWWLLAALAAACGGSDEGGGGSPGTNPLTPEQADEILAQHNLVRASVEPPPAIPLAALTWSTEAAAVAQAWANGCFYAHNSGRGSLGENIAANSPPGLYAAAAIVDAWASEADFYDYASNTCSVLCGHYTQVVWADTLRLGCGKATCPGNTSPFQNGQPWDFWVCNYDPPGNVAGQRPY